jgi:hypothetical protein
LEARLCSNVIAHVVVMSLCFGLLPQMEKRAAEIEVSRAQADELRQLHEEKLACQRRCRDLDSQVAINRERKRLAVEEARTELAAAEEAERIYKAKLEQFKVDTVEQSKRNYGQ